MQNTDRVSAHSAGTDDSRNESQEHAPVQFTISEKEYEFLQSVTKYPLKQMIVSLSRVHEMALYHTDMEIDIKDKEFLYDVYQLQNMLMAYSLEKE